jgi:hypothetical protein
VAETDKPDHLEDRFPAVAPIREAATLIDRARELVDAMPPSIVRTRAQRWLGEIATRHGELERNFVKADMFLANERAVRAAVRLVLPPEEGKGRRGRN